jgi:3-hydroxybutyryl-CoA dehydrogenase
MGQIKKVGVLGAGMMGADIALCCGKAGYQVLMKEINMELAQKGYESIKSSLDRWTSKGKLQLDEAGKKKTLEAIKPTDKFSGFEDVDFVIEAIFEDLKIKTETLQELEKICKPSCIIASNTSSISITKLGASFKSPARRAQFVGMHFFSPAAIMKLVEVIKGEETAEDAVNFGLDFCKSIDKEPVKVIDCVGFIVNRILYALDNEAMRLYEEGIATPEDIDKACRLGLGHPIGPFSLMDLTSNELNYKVGKILYEAYGERFIPRPSLVKKVDAGHFGRKTGKGWFDYGKK